MLTSLLPGIRDLRAPLAAGYLWLITLGLTLEPHVPDQAQATGLMASIYRLADGLSAVGLGVAASFVAYLIGSLSLALGTTPLRKLAPQTLNPERAGFWNAIPSGSLSGLMQVARETRERLEDLLSLSDTSLEAELKRWSEPGIRLHRQTLWDRVTAFIRLRRRPHKPTRLTSNSPAPAPPEEEQEQILFRALVVDLDVVTTTRLLGKDPDLYSAIDRSRAEGEFRLAIIPPLVMLGILVAVRLGGLVGGVVAVVAVGFAVGLHWDSVRHQREANALLVDALADGRVKSPSLERFEARALERATRSRVDAMRTAAGAAATAIARAIDIVEEMPSARSAIVAARQAVTDAKARFKAVTSIFPSAVVEPGSRALNALDQALGLWEEAWGNPTPPASWADSVKTLVGDARAHYEGYREAAREELQRVREQSTTSSELKVGSPVDVVERQ